MMVLPINGITAQTLLRVGTALVCLRVWVQMKAQLSVPLAFVVIAALDLKINLKRVLSFGRAAIARIIDKTIFIASATLGGVYLQT